MGEVKGVNRWRDGMLCEGGRGLVRFQGILQNPLPETQNLLPERLPSSSTHLHHHDEL